MMSVMWETPLAGNVPTANRSFDKATVRKVGSHAITPSNYELAEVCHSPPPVDVHPSVFIAGYPVGGAG